MEEREESWLDKVLLWLDERTGIYGHTLRPAPRYAYRLDFWLGSFVLAAFAFEVVTGMLVALYYIPADPYASTTFLISQVPLGALLFSLHSWGAYAMIFLLLIHMTRNFVVGAYRKPREVMWMVGTLLAALTLSEAYLGYSLPYNLISWTATTTGLNLFTYMPLGLSNLIAAFTLLPQLPGIASGVDPLVDRFFIFHWIVGALIGAVLGLHLYIFEKHGITPPLSKERDVSELIDDHKDRLERDPNWKLQPLTRTFGIILVTFLMTFGAIFLIASAFPFQIAMDGGQIKYLMPEYNPALAAQTPPIPDWYFLFIYFFYKSVSPSNASLIFLAWGAVTLLFPFIDQYIFRHRSSHPVMRPAAIALGTGFIISFIVNSVWAYLTPGRDIGPIGVEVDAVIFVMSFVALFPTLRWLQRRSEGKTDSFDLGKRLGLAYSVSQQTLTLPKPLTLGLDLSVILTGGLMVYISMKMLTLTNLLLDQFELGFLAGINMILFAYLVLIYTLRGAEQ
ncbi:cytochrome b subunit of the bc complex [Metallosphaera yellowstonensis MK1]|uniref:Cytochrome b subunit of the bc complex n=1 Tax=Metallosphaera yellowstonensis MK1 TaxID=671065 RepID=H2C5P7_9CREN|nr:cytochrome bc complex cytochrome b subunit [Metallosphaera yellowstonensis]EHP69124.1 cytochrome b subunit of the bc complex [Metallosphaera yellowstonensis MK1]